MSQPTHIMSILIPDAVGIISRIVDDLKALEVSPIEISQTLVHGVFTLTLVINIPEDKQPIQIRQVLQESLGQKASVVIQNYDIPACRKATDERYMLTAIGTAVPGLLNAITGLIQDKGGNFTDFSSVIAEGRITLLAEVDFPHGVALDQLQIDLRHACDSDEVAVRLQHTRLFEATNEVAFRRFHHA